MKYVFILGNMRSGTSWVAQVLSQSPTPLCYLREPLTNLKKYPQTSEKLQELWSVYVDSPEINYYVSMLADLPFSRKLLRSCHHTDIMSNSEKPKYLLIKEIHNIPAFHRILSSVDYKAVLIMRDPLRIVDSAFHNFRIRAMYRDEYAWLQKAAAGDTPISDKGYLYALKSLSPTMIKALCGPKQNIEEFVRVYIIVLFQHYILEYWATVSANVYPIVYDDLCKDSISEFKKMFSFVGLKFNNKVEQFIAEHNQIDERNDPFSTFLSSYLIGTSPYKALTLGHIGILKYYDPRVHEDIISAT